MVFIFNLRPLAIKLQVFYNVQIYFNLYRGKVTLQSIFEERSISV